VTARHLTCALAATAALALPAPTQAQDTTAAGAYDLTCFFADGGPDWHRQGMYAIACIKNNGYWVNGPNPMRLTGLASDGDGTHTLLERMNYGQEYGIVSDWDPVKQVSSGSWAPAGVWVTIRR
jgi:hypothetical protein